jgi:hypothetical protein
MDFVRYFSTFKTIHTQYGLRRLFVHNQNIICTQYGRRTSSFDHHHSIITRADPIQDGAEPIQDGADPGQDGYRWAAE